MALQPAPIGPVPDETARVARAAFPKGTRYLQMRDVLGTMFAGADVASLYPARGRPVEAPWRLALGTVMQFAEGLSDRQAAEAVRARIDWKYALGLRRDGGRRRAGPAGGARCARGTDAAARAAGRGAAATHLGPAIRRRVRPGAAARAEGVAPSG